MSKKYTTVINCPECNNKQEFTRWESINTTLDPELKQAVRDLSLFRFTCSNCGYIADVNYGFLYHQMEDHVWMHYITNHDTFDEINNFINTDNEMFKNLARNNYLIRIVFSRENLLEKLAIIDVGLDDRVIEILKFMISAYIRDKHGDDFFEDVYFVVGENNSYSLEFVSQGKSIGTYEITNEMYDNVKEDYSPFFEKIPEKNFIIDIDWAYNFWKTYRK